ncbi:VanZ family protein [Mesorhizobium kowhaii]|uniref:VanZ family protein n=1 Tax=Mesorhizobium kowhaii TaxID=1300272 RepID=UPI000DAD1C44|nr:VanZ family protein [Mesorhizobium kowhaii]
MTKLSRIAASALLAIIIFATLSPIQMRPHIAEANVERALAYVLLGFVLALGFPNRLYQAAIFVVATAGVLELLQIIDPGRHAQFADALVKASAGVIGIVAGQLFVRTSGRMRESSKMPR